MQIEQRKYGMIDAIKMCLQCAPVLTGLIVLKRILSGLVPTVQIVATAYFINTAIAVVQGEAAMSHIYVPLLAVVALIAYNWISNELIRFTQVLLLKSMREKLRPAIIERRAKLAYEHIENHESWNIISRVSHYPELKVRDAFNDMLSMTEMVIRVGGVFALLVAHIWWAALLILIVSAPLFALAIRSGKATYQANREVSKFKRKSQYLSEVLRGRESASERTLFGFGKAVNAAWNHEYETARKLELKTEAKWFVKMKSGSVISALISLIIIFILINPVMSGNLSIGMFIALVSGVFDVVGIMSWRLTNTTESLAKFREFMVDLTTFAALETVEGETDLPTALPAPFTSIEFRHVSFAYPGTTQRILDGLSLKLEAGKHYAFVGINGAGKTTITKLLTGLYDNYEGDILLNGTSIRDYSPHALKAYFAVVYQDFAKYEITVKANIAVGDIVRIANADTPIRVEQVVTQLGLKQALSHLEKGIDTPLGKVKSDGQDLSGGQWQRIAMARALISPAPIYILDEPTAALDPLSESKIYEEFEQISRDKTTLFISHRLGSTKLADDIFVIGEGKVLEQGSHEALMQLGGIYAEMYDRQRSWYE